MGFSEWLKANSYDEAALTAKQRTHLEAAWRTEIAAPLFANLPRAEPVAAAVTATRAAAPAPAVQTQAPQTSFDEAMAAIDAEARRVEYIRETTTRFAAQYTGYAANPAKLKDLRTLCDTAIENKKVTTRDFDHSLLMLDRQAGPFITTPRKEAATDEVIEAAICVGHRLKDVEKRFSPEVLQTAHTRFKRGIGLKEFLCMAAERNNGYRGSIRDDLAVWKAAFTPRSENAYDLRAEGVSTINVPDVLSNVANKFLTRGFLYVEGSWRKICKISPANDFKLMTTVRLTGATTFEKIGPDGMIKHATLGDVKYTNQAATYAKQLGISRQDIRNDDLGAFTEAGDQLGRGGGEAIAEIFWATFLNDAAFFPVNNSLGNYHADAVDSLLNLTGLAKADTQFRLQTKEDGTLLGKIPKILLVPTPLRTPGLNLMRSQQVNVATSTTAIMGTDNVWAGAYEVVDSAFLTQTAIGGSSLAWYLLADPNDTATIQVVFLDGVETPTIEIAELEFDRLGMAMRSWIDFGANLQEPKAGLKMKGAA